LDQIRWFKDDNGTPEDGEGTSAAGDAWQQAQVKLAAPEAEQGAEAYIIQWMMSSMLGDVHDYASMHACSMTEQDPRQVEVSSMPVVSMPQEQDGQACSIRCGEAEISLWKKPMEFPIQSHLWLTSAWRGYISMSMTYIAVEWRVRQHASKAVESTASCATAAILAAATSPTEAGWRRRWNT